MCNSGSLDDFKSALGQEAARAYLRRTTTVRSLELEPRAEFCGDLWMEYINRECTTDVSDPSCPTPFSPYEKIEEPFLQMTNLQTEADPCCTASSSRIANPVSPEKGTSATLYESHRDSKKYRKRGTGYNILDIVMRRLAAQQSSRLPRNSLGDLEGRRDFCDALTSRVHLR